MDENERPSTSADAVGIKANVVNMTNSTLIVQAGVDAKLCAGADDSNTEQQSKVEKCPEVSRNDVAETEGTKPSWKAVETVLSAVTPIVPETVTFGNHTFTCEARPYFHRWQMYWKGKCTDLQSGYVTVCKGVVSPVTSVQRAAAKLIREMVKQNKYPEPHDVGDMPTKE